MKVSRGILAYYYEHAKSTPDKLFVITKDDSLTYQEAFHLSLRVSRYLADFPLNNVIVYGTKEISYIPVMLGIAMSGTAYIPVSSDTPLERLRYIVENSRATIIINLTDEPLDVDAITVITTAQLQKVSSASSIAYDVDDQISEDPFYIIYTSGSTGHPKGVAISEKNIVTFLNWTLNQFDLDSEDILVNTAPFSFDLSVFEVFNGLVSGATLLLLPTDNIYDTSGRIELCANHQGTVIVATPSYISLLLLDPDFDENQLSLRKFIFCGEVLPNLTASKLIEKFPQAEIHNLYGPTEATCAVISVRITADICSRYEVLPVGQFSGRQFIDVDPESSELTIKGSSVAIGYYNDDEKTKASFYNDDDGCRVYKTGDTGYIEENMLFFKGRIDNQIKWKGYRIELDEISISLERIPEINQAVTIPKKLNGKITALIAFVKANESLDKSYINDMLQENLPPYMMPTVIKIVSDFPLTDNGKVNKKLLLEKY